MKKRIDRETAAKEELEKDRITNKAYVKRKK